MNLVIISHKESWSDPASSTGYATIGGFPFQMKAISQLFDQTQLLIMQRQTPAPDSLLPIEGHNMSIDTFPEPTTLIGRRVRVFTYLPALWRAVRQADAVHAPVPGDLGTLGILVALMQGKPLFVRHCGTWGISNTLPQRFLTWLLPRIAGGKTVVMATGGGTEPPSAQNADVSWIFSTSLTEAELDEIPAPAPWVPGETLKLIAVGRLDEVKNVQATIRALPAIRKQYPDVQFDVLGDGGYRPQLEALIDDLGLHDYVTLHGNVSHDEVIERLSQAHLFAFPTRNPEGFPKAVLEALACGLPVIVPPVSVLPHLVEDGAGYILPDTTPEAVAEAVLTLLADADRLRQMSAEAQAVSREYTLERWRATIGERLRDRWGPLKESD